jgi:hypothetical protein
LAALKGLKKLELFGTEVTFFGWLRLQVALPRCDILK